MILDLISLIDKRGWLQAHAPILLDFIRVHWNGDLIYMGWLCHTHMSACVVVFARSVP